METPRASEPLCDPERRPPVDDAREREVEADPARSAAARLFDELSDECSDVGVSVRGMNVASFEAGVRAYGREARRLGASVERTVILLKECLRDERLAEGDRAEYDRLREAAVRWVIAAYFDTAP